MIQDVLGLCRHYPGGPGCAGPKGSRRSHLYRRVGALVQALMVSASVALPSSADPGQQSAVSSRSKPGKGHQEMKGVALTGEKTVVTLAGKSEPAGLTAEQPKVDLQPADKSKNSKAITKEDTYPTVGKMEQLTFGSGYPSLPLTERLCQLERAVYRKTFDKLSLFERTQALSQTLLGVTEPAAAGYADAALPGRSVPYGHADAVQTEAVEPAVWKQPEYQKELGRVELERFALDLLNEERGQQGLNQLSWDDVAYRVASEQVASLIKRGSISHFDKDGENPDLRYTKAGGVDALTESLAAIKSGQGKHNKAMVARLIYQLSGHQDDRDALFSPDATNFAFSFGQARQKGRIICCVEVVTKHSIMHPIPERIHPGDKIDIKGVVLQPYHFDRVTVAWEASRVETPDPNEEENEALPYFPPLDFTAYARKAEHDRDKAIAVLRTAGIVACIAGGLFVPPVALAAPVIAMTGGHSELKPVSEIPVHGGIKVQGSMFSGNIALNNSGKEGIYYVTVWASSGLATKSVPISRRTVIAALDGEDQAHPGRPEEAKHKISKRN